MKTTVLTPFMLAAIATKKRSCYRCDTPIPTIDIDQNLITNDDAITMINDHGSNGIDSVSGHIPIDTLLSYIEFITSEAANGTSVVTGFEFYFAKKPVSLDPVESEKMTFLLYPTTLFNGEHVPFDPIASGAGGPVKFVDIMRDRTHMTNKVALNKSGMSPPRTNTII